MDVNQLEKLCAERPERTREKFGPNDYYGHASVIKKYCGLPDSFALPGIHPHGPSTTDLVWDVEIKFPLEHLLLVSEAQRNIYANVCAKPATVIGSPLYYALRLMEAEAKALAAEAVGTIVFPFHSTHHVTVQYDEDRFLKHLLALPAKAGPIVICMYWRDVQLGRHKRYVDAGFDCVSAGHIYDRDFLFRFIRLVSARRQCITNELGTCVFYSAALGLPVTIFRQDYRLEGNSDKLVQESSARPNLPMAERFLEISREPKEADHIQQRDLARLALGHAALWPAEKLKAFLQELAARQAPVDQPKPKRRWTERVAREVHRFKRRIGASS
jgi:hypothetical protein